MAESDFVKVTTDFTQFAEGLTKLKQATQTTTFRTKYLMVGPGIEWAEDKGDYIEWIDRYE